MIDYTKEELVELLRKNPEKFNEWKYEQEDVDLSEVDFSGLTLRDIDFTGVDLNSSSFADCNLSFVNFTNADLMSVDFTRAQVLDCDFTESSLTGADCSYAIMTYCNFTDCDLAGCIFSETDLSNSDLTTSYNLHASRYDEDTVWPDSEYLPEDFNPNCSADLSMLRDDEDTQVSDY